MTTQQSKDLIDLLKKAMQRDACTLTSCLRNTTSVTEFPDFKRYCALEDAMIAETELLRQEEKFEANRHVSGQINDAWLKAKPFKGPSL